MLHHQYLLLKLLWSQVLHLAISSQLLNIGWVLSSWIGSHLVRKLTTKLVSPTTVLFSDELDSVIFRFPSVGRPVARLSSFLWLRLMVLMIRQRRWGEWELRRRSYLFRRTLGCHRGSSVFTLNWLISYLSIALVWHKAIHSLNLRRVFDFWLALVEGPFLWLRCLNWLNYLLTHRCQISMSWFLQWLS